MAIKSGVNVDGALVPNAVASVYTPGTGITRSKIEAATFFANVGATLTVYIVPSAGSPDTTNQIVTKTLVANETYTPLELIGQSVEFGGSIQADDGAAGGTNINFVATVTDYSGDD